MWKSLFNLRGWLEGKAQRRQYLLVVGLGCYKWYQSTTPNDFERCDSKEAEPWRGWTWGSVPARTLAPKGEWIEESHIDWRKEQVPARLLASKEGRLSDPTSIGGREQSVLEALRGNPKGKVQRGQYLLASALNASTLSSHLLYLSYDLV